LSPRNQLRASTHSGRPVRGLPRRLLDITSLEQLFGVFDTVDAALEADQ
jgi:hypothetical protein